MGTSALDLVRMCGRVRECAGAKHHAYTWRACGTRCAAHAGLVHSHSLYGSTRGQKTKATNSAATLALEATLERARRAAPAVKRALGRESEVNILYPATRTRDAGQAEESGEEGSRRPREHACGEGYWGSTNEPSQQQSPQAIPRHMSARVRSSRGTPAVSVPTQPSARRAEIAPPKAHVLRRPRCYNGVLAWLRSPGLCTAPTARCLQSTVVRMGPRGRGAGFLTPKCAAPFPDRERRSPREAGHGRSAPDGPGRARVAAVRGPGPKRTRRGWA